MMQPNETAPQARSADAATSFLAEISPTIACFLRLWGDTLSEGDSALLETGIISASRSNTGEADNIARSWMILDWLIRVYTPTWVRAEPVIAERAGSLESLEPIADGRTALLAHGALLHVKSGATGAAIGSAGAVARHNMKAFGVIRGAVASIRTRQGVRAALGVALGASAGDAAWATTEIAGRGATQIVDGPLVVGAARETAKAAQATRLTAALTMRKVAKAAVWHAWIIAISEGRPVADVLMPTVKQLQASALRLVMTMAALGRSNG